MSHTYGRLLTVTIDRYQPLAMIIAFRWISAWILWRPVIWTASRHYVVHYGTWARFNCAKIRVQKRAALW